MASPVAPSDHPADLVRHAFPAEEVGTPRALIVVPTYDERATIAGVIGGVLRQRTPLPVDVLVVDSASPDGTAEEALRAGAAGGRVHVLQQGAKRGLGEAYRDGMRWAFARGYAFVVTMDGDGSHDPDDLPRLLEGIERLDYVLGSRYADGGGVRRWSFARRALSRGANAFARAALGLPFRDVTAGYNCIRASLLADVMREGLASDGYAFHIESKLLAWRRGARFAERGIVFTERRAGRSKISRRILLEAALFVLRESACRQDHKCIKKV